MTVLVEFERISILERILEPLFPKCAPLTVDDADGGVTGEERINIPLL
jgi:hypothetical protein